MAQELTLPEGLRMMAVYALEVRTWEGRTYRFIRRQDLPTLLWKEPAAAP